MKRLLIIAVRTIAITYAALVLLVAGCQNSLLYHPTRDTEAGVLAQAGGFVEPWRDAKGGIIGWRKPNPRATARLVVFHGNAGYALHRKFYLNAFQSLDGGAKWEVFLFEYPGYGARPGSVGKDSFTAAGKSAIEELLAADTRPLFILGESVGSGIACAVVDTLPQRIAGIALVVPFARMQEVAHEKFPWLPTSLILRDKYDNIAALARHPGPVAIVIAEEDEVVGAAQGRKLFENYPGKKLLIPLPDTGHNSLPTHPSAEWFQRISDFLSTGTR